ncbi:MAG: diguanylate cyclase [Desulfobacterales bacterium]|nr:diguanylate cyclase [Desulfobacterales bacterium]
MIDDIEKQKILIVDDIPLNIQVLNDALEADYRTFFATNGRDALDIATTVMPDLILLDIKMPEMNGYDVCRKIKEDAILKDIPIIFITSLNQEEDETIGLELGAVDYISKPFSPAIVKLRVRNHLELKKQRDLLSRLSSLDGLTGISNRRIFDERYKIEWKRAVRNGKELSLILLDIDYFKAFNDNYGHLLGDSCLKNVAQAIASVIRRPADLAARYGGEEFICLLPDTNLKGATIISQDIMKKIYTLGVPHAYSSTSTLVTVSIGTGTISNYNNQSPEKFLDYVDKLLYQAKKEGRNRIVNGEYGEL